MKDKEGRFCVTQTLESTHNAIAMFFKDNKVRQGNSRHNNGDKEPQHKKSCLIGSRLCLSFCTKANDYREDYSHSSTALHEMEIKIGDILIKKILFTQPGW